MVLSVLTQTPTSTPSSSSRRRFWRFSSSSSKTNGNSFWVNVADEEWEDAQLQIKSTLKSPADTYTALLKVLKSPTVPPKFIETLLQKLGKSPELRLQFLSNEGDLWPSLVANASLDTLQCVLSHFMGRLILPNTSSGKKDKEAVLLPTIACVEERISALWRDFLKSSGNDGKVKKSSYKSLTNVKCLDDLEKEPTVKVLWLKTELLLRSAMQRDLQDPSKQDKHWIVTHAIAEACCPTVVMWMALRLYPEQLTLRDGDAGWLSLHQASSRLTVRSKKTKPIQYYDDMEDCNLGLVAFLVKQYPEGPKCAAHDGTVPLVLSLELLGSADEEYHDTILHSLILPLVEGAPDCLTTRDPIARFWPFLLAAARNASVDIIFRLLNANPIVLNYRNKTSAEQESERFLHERNILKSEKEILQEENRQLKLELERIKSQKS